MSPFSSLRHRLHRSTIPIPVPLRRTILTLATLLTWYPLFLFFHDHVGQMMWVTGSSMYPFLNTDYNATRKKEAVWVEMFRPAEGLRRGMVVAFWSPQHPEKMAIKRIVALEGDTVLTRAPYPFPRTQVPFGHVWVEGEHPEYERNTLDSNTYGPISKSLVVGKVRGVVWPWARASWIRWQEYRASSRVIPGKIEEPERW